MKPVEQLTLAIEKKQAELLAVKKRIDELNIWIEANNVFAKNDTAFLSKLFTEKAEENRRFEQLQAQVNILKWCVE